MSAGWAMTAGDRPHQRPPSAGCRTLRSGGLQVRRGVPRVRGHRPQRRARSCAPDGPARRRRAGWRASTDRRRATCGSRVASRGRSSASTRSGASATTSSRPVATSDAEQQLEHPAGEAKWPRWFVPNCISWPCAVRRSGSAMTPALFISTSIRSTSSAQLVLLPARPSPGRRGRAARSVGCVAGGDRARTPASAVCASLRAATGHDHRRPVGREAPRSSDPVRCWRR